MQRGGIQEKGVSVIEVLIALSFASVLIVAIGSALSGVHRLDDASAKREQATAFARESLEIVVAAQKDLLVCSPVAGGSCTRNGQTCTPLQSVYTSCWLDRADGGAVSGGVVCSDVSPCYLEQSFPGSPWYTVSGNDPGIPSPFTREVIIMNLQRNADGEVVALGGVEDPNTKRVTVRVCWDGPCDPISDRNKVSVQSILTGWKNVP